jgi:hypothetical protein
MLKLFQKNPVEIGLAGISATYFLFNSGAIQTYLADINTQKAAISQADKQTTSLQLDNDVLKERAKIAEERYKAGLVLVVSTAHPDTYASLVEGYPVMDRTNRTPLPAGTIAGDANGNTCVIVKSPTGLPVCGNMAFTGNQSVIQAALAATKSAKFYNPNI